jgi:hypothetical protein
MNPRRNRRESERRAILDSADPEEISDKWTEVKSSIATSVYDRRLSLRNKGLRLIKRHLINSMYLTELLNLN